MKAFITTGTFQFLKNITKDYPEISFYFMSGDGQTLVFYEHEEKEVFSSGRAYDIVSSLRTIQDEGYVVMNHIPFREEGQPVFEYRLKENAKYMKDITGFITFLLLKPLKNDTYIVLTQWESKADFKRWKDSDSFQQAHKIDSIQSPSYQGKKPLLKTYSMINQDEF